MEENLGKKLRSAREAAGLTIDDAVYRAKMPRAVVEALESEDFGFFTSPLYARSFLKQYGGYVGLDVTPWLDDLVPTALIDGDTIESFIEIDEPTPAIVIRENKKDTRGGGAMAAMWIILITGGLIWGGMKLFQELEGKSSKSPAPTTRADKQPPAQSQPPVKKPEKPEDKPTATDGPEPAKRAIIVIEE